VAAQHYFPEEEAAVAAREALRHLRSETQGVLSFDEHTQPVRYILDPATGRIVMPVIAAAVLASEHILHTPDESDDAMSLLLSPDEIDRERDSLVDRWRAHHSQEQDVNFVSCVIDMVRWRGMVIDGDAMMAPNPLAQEESDLLRSLNADKARLRAICAAAARVDVPAPTAVSVDPDGVHVRARFGVVRIVFAQPVDSLETARSALDALARTHD